MNRKRKKGDGLHSHPFWDGGRSASELAAYIGVIVTTSG